MSPYVPIMFYDFGIISDNKLCNFCISTEEVIYVIKVAKLVLKIKIAT